MRYRGKSKIKRQHHLIDELDHFLRKIEDWPEILAVNPGVIAVCRHNDNLKFSSQAQTKFGLRCLAKSHGAVQEVFLVSDQIDILENKLKQYLAKIDINPKDC